MADPFERFRLRAAYATFILFLGSSGWDAFGHGTVDLGVLVTLSGTFLALMRLGSIVRIVTGGEK